MMSLLKSIEYYLVLIYVFSVEIIGNLFYSRRICKSKARLDGKVVVITGANTGIGKETAYQLSLRGGKIIIGCRDMKKTEIAVKDIKSKNPKADITYFKLDLSSLKSVRQFVKSVSEEESKIDILINNAGVGSCPEWTTEDGFEMHFGTNHLSHFLLTLSLMPLLRNSLNARVINVSAALYMVGEINFENINLRNGAYTPMRGYAQSKLANILFTREMARRLGSKSSIKTYCLHPGAINTELQRHNDFRKFADPVIRRILLSIEMGTQTTLYCALEESIENESGMYYDDCKRVDKMLSKATDDESAKRLWEMSCDLVKLEDRYRI